MREIEVEINTDVNIGMCTYVYTYILLLALFSEWVGRVTYQLAPRFWFLKYHSPEERTELLGEIADSRDGHEECTDKPGTLCYTRK